MNRFQYFINDFFWTRAFTVNLVDNHDRRQVLFQRLFASTNRVCGIVPSKASTTSSTPSTIFITRSTSPPKSAWPGVSRMLIWYVTVLNGRVLGEDGDPTFTFNGVGIHCPIL
jgi:hypothetical protein